MLWRRMSVVALLAVGIAALTSSMKATAGENSSSVTFIKTFFRFSKRTAKPVIVLVKSLPCLS